MRTEATDPEERALTADGAPARLRDKHVARTAAAAMVPGALLFLVATVAVALGADPAAPRIAALLPFAAFALLTWSLVANSVVRSVVTDRALRVQWGTRRYDVPLAAITACEARPRSGAVGWSLFADRGAVQIAWTEGSKARAILLPANDPEALAAALNEARGGGTGVRVETHEPAAAEALAPSDDAATARRRAG